MWTILKVLTEFVTGLPWWLSGKEPTCQCKRRGFNLWVGKIPWRRKWQPTPVFLPGKSHGQRNLVGYPPPGSKRIWPDLATKQLNLLQCCFCFMFWFFGCETYGILASWVWTCTPCLGRRSLNHWAVRKSLFFFSMLLPSRVHGSDLWLLRGVVLCLSEWLPWPSVSRPWVWSSFPCSREGFDRLCPHPLSFSSVTSPGWRCEMGGVSTIAWAVDLSHTGWAKWQFNPGPWHCWYRASLQMICPLGQA